MQNDIRVTMIHKKKLNNSPHVKLLELVGCLQWEALAWIEAYFGCRAKDFVCPKVKLSFVNETRTYGRYALDNIGLSLDSLSKKLQIGIINQDKYLLLKEQQERKLLEIRLTENIYAGFTADNVITLNVNNINKFLVKFGVENKNFYAEIMLHEMFHAYHWHQLIDKNKWNVPVPEIAKVNTVKETLAVYLEYKWLKERNLNLQKEFLYKRITGPNRYFPSYPYAGARNLLTENDFLNERRFQAIYHCSLKSWDDAYKLLASFS